jgi:hypothetical protein
MIYRYIYAERHGTTGQQWIPDFRDGTRDDFVYSGVFPGPSKVLVGEGGED